MAVSEKGPNFALAFGKQAKEMASGEPGARKKSEKIWWFEKVSVTLQNICKRRPGQRAGVFGLEKKDIDIIAIDEVVQELFEKK